jgi:kynurenine 3-monooxygenase
VDALANGDAQEEIMKQIMQMPNIADIWESEEVDQKILSLL